MATARHNRKTVRPEDHRASDRLRQRYLAAYGSSGMTHNQLAAAIGLPPCYLMKWRGNDCLAPRYHALVGAWLDKYETDKRK